MIRKIKENDIPSCADILKDAYGKHPYNESFEGDNAVKYILEKYNSCKDDSFVFIDDDKRIVAFIFLKISAWSDGPQAIIEEIAVSPSVQSSGIGKKLMRHSREHLNSRGVKSVMLWAKNNDRLLGFYKNHGFSPADDFVVMFRRMD